MKNQTIRPGQRYGRLVVVEQSDQRRAKDRSILWVCQCDCGNRCLKPTRELNAGSATSCGCAWRTPAVHPGERFGRLVAVEPTQKRRSKSVVWRCRCDCGRETEVQSNSLRSGHVSSCGCLKAELDRGRPLKNLTYVDGTCIEFLKNIHVPTSASTTGTRGVTQKKNGKYQATINFRKKRYYLGTYATLEEAVKARCKGEEMVADYLADYQQAGKRPPEGQNPEPVEKMGEGVDANHGV